MGGYALAGAVRRFDALEFIVLRGEVLSRLRAAMPRVRIKPIPSYYGKPSHGDLDLLLCLETAPQDWRERACEALSCRAQLRNGPVYSVEHRQLQVDLISVCAEHFEFSLSYFSWNDLGNLIGRIAHRAGLKLGHDGLWVNLRDGTHLYASACVTRDFGRAIGFLGYNAQRFYQGFDTLEDIFRYVTSTRHFDPGAFPLEMRSHRARIRDAKRPTYRAFLHWVERNAPPATLRILRTREVWLAAACKAFPGLRLSLDRLRDEHARKKEAHARFNGNLVREWTGLEGRALGAFMRDLLREANASCAAEYAADDDIEGVRARVIEAAKAHGIEVRCAAHEPARG